MAYSALTFTASEVPTLTKWNQLWANDASMNDGTGIGSNAITTAKIAAGAVDGTKLSAGAVYLGQASSTTNFSTASTSPVLITGLTKTVTVPSGGRSVLILFTANDLYNAGAGTVACELSYWKGSVGGTRLQMQRPQQTTGGQSSVISGFALDIAPTAGSQTYAMGLNTSNAANSANIDAGATNPTQMVILLI